MVDLHRPASNVTLTATFVDLTKPLLLYFDFDDNNKLRVGNWGTQVDADNIAFFKFASVVGFTLTSASDTWGSGDIKFNPTLADNETWEADADGFQAIPAWNSTGTTVTKPSSYSITTNLDYVSTTVHTIANVKAGYGDPCQLVGYTGAEISAMSSLPASSFRLPTMRENDTFVGYTGTPTADNIGTTYGTWMSGSPGYMTFPQSTPANKVLPAAGGRNFTDGSVRSWGTLGRYWSATPISDTGGYGLGFYLGDLHPSDYVVYGDGRAVRCVPQ